MKILALLVSLSPLIAAVSSTNAPLDQYFGKLKMSAVRIRYEIMQLRPRYETHKLLPEETEHLLDLDANAFYAWAAAYPKDNWLASTGYMLGNLYAELPGTAARDAAVQAYTFVKTRFPKTTYAKQSVALLHRGIPVRPDPAWAVAMRASRAAAASPAPSGTAGPAMSASPAMPASPAPSATLTPSAKASFAPG
jgi:hypothetical protein